MVNSLFTQELVERKMMDELELAIERSWSNAATAGTRATRLEQLRRDAGRFLIGVGERVQGRPRDAGQIRVAAS